MRKLSIHKLSIHKLSIHKAMHKLSIHKAMHKLSIHKAMHRKLSIHKAMHIYKPLRLGAALTIYLLLMRRSKPLLSPRQAQALMAGRCHKMGPLCPMLPRLEGWWGLAKEQGKKAQQSARAVWLEERHQV